MDKTGAHPVHESKRLARTLFTLPFHIALLYTSDLSLNQFKNMKNISLSKVILLALALTATVVVPRLAVAGDTEYSFVLHNTTEEKITALMVSEDGEKWGKFDIGSGLKAGASAK